MRSHSSIALTAGAAIRAYGDALALLDVEHGVIAKQDGLALDRVSVCVFGFSRANLPEDNPCAVLALANVSTAFRGLLVASASRASRSLDVAKQEHVDSAIFAPADQILGCLRSPRPVPRRYARLQLLEDLLCDDVNRRTSDAVESIQLAWESHPPM